MHTCFPSQNNFNCTDMESLKAPLDIPIPDPAKEEEKRKKKEEVAVKSSSHLRGFPSHSLSLSFFLSLSHTQAY